MTPQPSLVMPLKRKPAILPLRKNANTVDNYNEYRDGYYGCKAQYESLIDWHKKADAANK